MITYNITFNIDDNVLAEGLDYLRKTFIPTVLAGGKLSKPCIMRISQRPGEYNGNNYAVQFHAATLSDLSEWIQNEEMIIFSALHRQFGEAICMFPTILEEVKM
jgi:hypothetical protein